MSVIKKSLKFSLTVISYTVMIVAVIFSNNSNFKRILLGIIDNIKNAKNGKKLFFQSIKL